MKEQACKLASDDPNFLHDEWLITNGLSGYACGSASGIPMRKYHGLLIASLKPPYGRCVMLNFIEDTLILSDKRELALTQVRTRENMNIVFPKIEFRMEANLPIWSYYFENIHLEKRIWLAHGQNTVYVRYHLLSSLESVSIKWRPYFHYRMTEQNVLINDDFVYDIHSFDSRHEIRQSQFPILRLSNKQNPELTIKWKTKENVYYEIEEKRGYECYGSLTSPGYFTLTLEPQQKTTFLATTEEWDIIEAMSSDEALIAENQRQKAILRAAKPLPYSSTLAKLVLAADQFIFTPLNREKDAVRLKAIGEDVRSIIAGYPWFTDWGRDTMISLEGLTLTTGRPWIAHAILRTFAYYIHQGLIPNMFPDGQNLALYHTSDATLWFFHAVDRYYTLTHDEDFLEYMIPKLQEIIDYHIKGTLFGIKVGNDGLLLQGQDGYQLTWMDAKVGDWIVTPRRGSAVEINALWYNALKLLELWTGKPAKLAKKCYESFNQTFWYEDEGYLYDVVGENGEKDTSLRPNQILSISLRFPVLDKERWKSVVDIVKKELLTDFGLRTLSSTHPDYKSKYEGDIWARDAAYHQGTVWPWLIGPFIDAWLKVYPERIDEAKSFLGGIEKHIDEHCIGSIAEIFDAQDPNHAKGCFAQAWSVAEFLRAYVKVHVEFQNKA